jgi:hopene-associated glycosyltransferase HpnB
VPVPVAAACLIAAIAWAYLLAGHGGYWRTGQRLPPAAGDPPAWPDVVAVIPARNEAAGLPATLPTLLAQDYPGTFSVLLVDDQSSDGTADVATVLASGGRPPQTPPGASTHPPPLPPSRPPAGRRGWPGSAGLARGDEPRTGMAPLRVVAGTRPPDGWAGKVWAMEQGRRAAGQAAYLLFTDADIAYRPGTLTALVRAAEADDRALVSQMALLRADTFWERLLVPAFVYFFAQLYPFRRVNRPGGRTAAAAGGCMLVRGAVLEAAGGFGPIGSARIDDVALGRLLKRRPARCWLGLTTSVASLRPYPSLSGLWDMISRSAFTQLRYSLSLLAGTVVGLLWLYALPPAAALAGLAWLAAGGPGRGTAAAGWLTAAGLAGWALMTASYVPILRLYRLSPLRAPGLPLIALLYAAMTVDSARRYYAGRGGQWKGRTIPADRPREPSADR